MVRPAQSAGVTRRQFIAGGGAVLGLAALAACGTGTSGASNATAQSTAKRGGTLRFGYFQAATTDNLDIQRTSSDYVIGCGVQVYSSLLKPFGGKRGGKVVHDQTETVLAESVELERPTSVVVRLKPNLEFHNGQPITANDVLASFARILDTANPGSASPALSQIDIKSSRVVDNRTVRFVLSSPNAFILRGFANPLAAIYPNGKYDPSIGSGPFRVKKFTPGDSAEYTRFENYFKPAKLDGLVIQNFADDTAKLNALRSGAIDMAGKMSPSLAQTLGSNFTVYESETGGWGGFVMDAKSDAFKDARVRQAFRLLVDRPGLRNQLLAGKGKLGNDLFSPFDPAYVGDQLPQRQQDLAKAKSLLKAAGAESMTLDLATSGFIPNLEVAVAQQARAAGVTINVRQVDSTTYFSQHYGQDPLFATLWPNNPVSTQLALAVAPGAFFPEGSWNNPQFLPLWTAAVQDQDEKSRNDKLRQIQRLFYDDGTYIIWGFNPQIDAASSNVAGVQEDDSSYPLSWWDFTNVGFA